MRKIIASAFLLLSVMAAPALASVKCLAPLDRLVSTSRFLSTNMVVHPDKEDASITLTYRDDPRTVVNFSLSEPMPSLGLSRSEYVEKYQKTVSQYVKTVQAQNREIETSYYPVEPIGWKVIEQTSMESIGPVYQGVISIRFGENCLLSANFITPNSPNLESRMRDLSAAVTGLRETSSRFFLSTDFEPEDTAPRGLIGLAVGFGAPLLASLLLYLGLNHYTRLDPPSRSTRAVVASNIVLSLLVLIQQKQVFTTGLAIMKYTDAFLLLVFCASVCAVSLALKQKSTVYALTVSAVTGGSLLASGSLGWSADPIGYMLIGGVMSVISILGFAAWNYDFRTRRFED